MKNLLLGLLIVVSMFIIASGACIVSKLGPFGQQPGVQVVETYKEKTIWIQGNVYEGDFKEFYEQTLDESVTHYNMIISTNGGDAHATTAIINRIFELKKQGCTFTTEVYGKAFSAGAFLFMMGDHRIMHQGSQLMWHTVLAQLDANGTRWKMGKNREVTITMIDRNIVRVSRNVMPYLSDELIDNILLQTGMTWMGAAEALHHGIASEVIYN